MTRGLFMAGGCSWRAGTLVACPPVAGALSAGQCPCVSRMTYPWSAATAWS
ncbi:hypothetical protein [Rugosimonospora africana]|uniref:hypothetical protein n=1 Tax=Rugosimonospora africana TaxID=556532 RepID=UPI001944F86C|nr:hypothetical protein [Rugosimonospora africana]